MPLEASARIVSELTSRGYNAEREAVTKLASAENPQAALERVVEDLPEDALVVRTDHVDSTLLRGNSTGPNADAASDSPADPAVSTGDATTDPPATGGDVPVETKGVGAPTDRSIPRSGRSRSPAI